MNRFLIAFIAVVLLGMTSPKPTSAASPTIITATITVTNTAGTTNGQTITVNSDTRTWTNSVSVPASQILTNSTIAGCSSNLYNAVADAPFLNLSLGQLTNGITLQTVVPNGPMVVTLSAGWGTVVLSTNTLTSAVAVRVPLSVEYASNQVTIANYLAQGLEVATYGISNGAPVLSNMVNVALAQTITGKKTLQSPVLTNATSLKSFFDTPILTNGVNYGNAFSSPGTNSGSEQFGSGAVAETAGASVFGPSSAASGSGSIAVGGSSLVVGVNSSGFGSGLTVNGPNNTAAGAFANTAGQNASAYGEGAIANTDYSTALGTQASATGTNSTAVGQGASAAYLNSTAVGQGATATGPNQVMLGKSTQTVAIPGNLNVGGVQQNTTFSGTNIFQAGSDIAFGRYALATLANGNNAAVAVGTNVFVEVSGPTGAFTINGIAGGRDGKFLIILNRTGQSMTLANDSGVDPTASNRLYSNSGTDQTIGGNCSAILIYSAAAGHWMILAFNNGTFGSYTAGYSIAFAGSQINWNGPAQITNHVNGPNVDGSVSSAIAASTTVNGVNSGNAFSSPGSASSSEKFGNGASATGTSSTALGASANASASQATSIGQGSGATANQSTALGAATLASHASSTAIGYFAADTEAHQVILGTSGEHVAIPGYIELGSALTLTISTGAGSPNSVVTAPPGSLYLNTSGGAGVTLYVKESGTGNTGWVAK